MSYIRYGEQLSSGKRSNYFILGNIHEIINIDEDAHISYSEIRKLMQLNIMLK